MALHGGTPLPLALNSVTRSEAADFFASRAFASYRSSLEGRQRVIGATLTRLDNIIRGIGVVSKILGRRQ